MEIDRRVDASVARLDEETKAQAGQCPLRSLIELLCTIPGVSTLGAMIILSEIGRDAGRFPTAGHLVAWAGLCPGQERERRQAQVLASSERPLAEDPAGPMRLVGQ